MLFMLLFLVPPEAYLDGEGSLCIKTISEILNPSVYKRGGDEA